MVANPKATLRAYSILTFGPIVGLYIMRPQWGFVLWPATILNGLLCSWIYRQIDRREQSEERAQIDRNLTSAFHPLLPLPRVRENVEVRRDASISIERHRRFRWHDWQT
jgi:hypothetical protein